MYPKHCLKKTNCKLWCTGWKTWPLPYNSLYWTIQ